MKVFTDEDVPDSVAQFLTSRGHEVFLVREYFLPATEDVVIAKAASAASAVVVTWDRRHFRDIAKRRSKSGTLSYPGMSVIAFRCPETQGRARLEQVIEEVGAIHKIRLNRGESRVIIVVATTVVRIED